MTLLDQLKAQQRRERAKGKKTKAKKGGGKKRVPSLTPSQSKSRVAKLRAQGYTVTRRRLPDGTLVVLKSKKKKKKSSAPKRMKSRGERLRALLKGYYRRGELGKASRLRARMKKAGLSTKT